MNLHIVRNAVIHDSRVLKETHSLAESGLVGRVEICGFHERGCGQDGVVGGRTIHRVRLSTRGLPKDLVSQTVKYAEWYARVVRRYRAAPLRVIHCHDLAPLPIATTLKRLTGARLVYDAHELETETNGLSGLRQRLAVLAERRLMRDVDAVITVSPSIQEWYRVHYGEIPVGLVRNVPEFPEGGPIPRQLRVALGVPDDALLFIYLGGLGRGRGIDIALRAFADSRVRHHVVFVGDGPMRAQIEAAARACPRVHWIAPVPPSEVVGCAAGADVGLCLVEDVCLSYRYCLPNKLFESLLAGLPVLASDLPDQAALVTAHRAGWVVPNDSREIAGFLADLDPRSARKLRTGLAERVAGLRWEHEAAALLDVYRQLLGGVSGERARDGEGVVWKCT